MGCGVTKISHGHTPVDHPEGIWTAGQKAQVRHTWRHLADDMTGNGSKVFLKIFDLEPKVKDMFHFTGMSEDEIVHNVIFKGHASRFMQAVGAVVENLDDPDKELTGLLHSLGAQHRSFNAFEVNYFAVFSTGMFYFWELKLGKRLTGDAREGWRLVFNFIMDKLKEGYELQPSGDQTDT